MIIFGRYELIQTTIIKLRFYGKTEALSCRSKLEMFFSFF